MIEVGTRIEMTKGYKGVQGEIKEITDSPYNFFVVRLDNDINIIAGPSGFVEIDNHSS